MRKALASVYAADESELRFAWCGTYLLGTTAR
jgi:hypothetical protein